MREAAFGRMLRQHAAWSDQPRHTAAALGYVLGADAAAVRSMCSDKIALLASNTIMVLASTRLLLQRFHWSGVTGAAGSGGVLSDGRSRKMKG